MAAEITDEVDASGQAIADFIGELGLSVAKGQGALDENTAKIAEKLSTTLVDVPAVIQETFDNDGIATGVNIKNNKVPMSTIVLPVAYQFSRVFYQADLKLSEMDKNNGVRLVKNASKLKVDARVNLDPTSLLSGGIPGVNAGGSGAISGSSSRNTTTASTDSAIATLHFEATLEPRREVQVPTPVRLRIAPRIMVAVTNFVETAAQPAVAAAVGPPAVAAQPAQPANREVTISVQVFSVAGADVTAASGPRMEFSVDAPELLLLRNPGAPVVLTVRRTQAGADAMPARAQTTVRATLGALTQQISVSI